jgi:hypothetical protein
MIFLHVYSCVHAYSCAFNAECSHKNYSTYADLYACTHTKPNSKCTWRGFRAVLTQFWRTRTRSYIAQKNLFLLFFVQFWVKCTWRCLGALRLRATNSQCSVILHGYYTINWLKCPRRSFGPRKSAICNFWRRLVNRRKRGAQRP